MILAVIADLHGNSWALRAVPDDIERRKAGHGVNLSDCAYGALDPAGTLGLLMARAVAMIECRALSARFLAYQRQQRAQRLAVTITAMRQAAHALHRQSIYPSQERVMEMIDRPGAAWAPEARAAWRAALVELGYRVYIVYAVKGRRRKDSCNVFPPSCA